MSIAPRQGTCPHHQAYWLSAKKTPSIEKVFLITSHQLVLLNDQYKKKLPFLYSTCAASTVFLKTSLSLSRASSSLPTNRSTHAVASTVQLLPAPWRSYCVPLIVNKSLGHTSPIGPLLVSCLIHCRSPTPSAILLRLTEFRSSSDRTSLQLSTSSELLIFARGARQESS